MRKAEKGLITAFLLISMMFLSGVFAVQGSLLSSMIRHFELTAANQGTANTVAFAGGLAALVMAFSLKGRWQKRTLLKAAIMVCALGLLLMWLAPGYAMYVAAWFVAGFGLGLMDALLSACMADLYTGKLAVTMMCLLHTSNGLSSVLMPMVYAGLLDSGMAWQKVYMLIGLAGLAIVAAAWTVKKIFGMADTEDISGQQVRLKEILPALKNGRLMWLVAAIFFHGIFLSGLNTWINRYAEGIAGMESLPAQSCVFIGLMLSRLLMPFLPVKTEKYVLWAGIGGGALLCVGLVFPVGWVLRVMLILSSLCFGALIPCVITLGCARQQNNSLLCTTGIMLALYLGQGVSSPVIAWLEGLFSLRAGMFLCAGCMALSSLCCMADRKGKMTVA